MTVVINGGSCILGGYKEVEDCEHWYTFICTHARRHARMHEDMHTHTHVPMCTHVRILTNAPTNAYSHTLNYTQAVFYMSDT